MLQIGPDRWVNPRYIVGAILHEETEERILTLTLDGSANTPDQYLDITGPWIERVMVALDMFDPYDKAAAIVRQANERHAARLAGKVTK